MTMNNRRPMACMAGMAAMALAFALMPTAHAQADVVFHEGDGTSFEIADIQIYNQHKAEFDTFTKSMGAMPPLLNQWFGTAAPPIFHFRITHGGCGIGISSTTITVGDTCLINKWTADAQQWPRETSFFFLGYAIFIPVTGGWPYEAWSDPLFKVIQTDLTRQLDGSAAAAQIESQVDTDAKKKKYQFYRNLKETQGWPLFQEVLRLMKAEGIDLAKIGGDPSPVRYAYIYAYLSLAGMKKMGNAAHDMGVADVDNAKVMDVLRARALLLNADRKGKAPPEAWTAYKTGKYADVRALLPAMGLP